MKREVISYGGVSIALILLLLLCAGCSTGRNTAVTRAYHELTTRYNVYHNAEQAYHEILQEQARTFTDRYDSLLPLYPQEIPTGKQLPGGAFDGVVEKCSKAIWEHSITTKPRRDPTKRQTTQQRQWLQQEEFNPFLQNVWMLLGKAHLQNGDLEEALAVFSHISRIYRQNEAIVNESTIWMMRCYTELNRLYQAEKSARVLMTLSLPDHLQHLFEETYTGYLLQRSDHQAAIPWLKRVITHEKERSQKRRLHYLLGQLLQLTGEKEAAYQAFGRVKSLSTPFGLKLQATVSQLPLAPPERQSIIRRSLDKMKTNADNDQLQLIEQVLAGRGAAAVTDGVAGAGEQQQSFIVNDSLLRISLMHDSLYQEVYHAFMEGDTARVATTASLFARQFPESAWLPQLKEMQMLATNGLPPGSPPGAAWESLAESNLHRQTQNEPYFLADRQGPHLFLLAYERFSCNRNELLFATAAFNFSSFRLRTFDLSFLSFGTREALAVRSFQNYDDAHRYGEMLLNDSLFATTIPAGVMPVVISRENVERLQRRGSLDDYRSFQEIHMPSEPLRYLPVETAEENEINREEKEKKMVPLNPDRTTSEQMADDPIPAPVTSTERLTPAQLLEKLEQNAREAMKQSQEQSDSKSREEQLKERERLREDRIRQREKDLKERARRREEQLRQREKEREQKIRKR